MIENEILRLIRRHWRKAAWGTIILLILRFFIVASVGWWILSTILERRQEFKEQRNAFEETFQEETDDFEKEFQKSKTSMEKQQKEFTKEFEKAKTKFKNQKNLNSLSLYENTAFLR